ncbi:hypothetical protein CLV51_105161 [Chitinophaga niastensis]|uniref:Uncharacterized protein n=1 Tax=Chitinophaga niastensis TaxID=536980 RepID=A0A2P8HEZ0_CHINA|nr:hypothetical protein [Chitinophaga niastensis]PSL44789.1 hypothetical protein CLV51_105161 [Chitinophaga niastensis]
MSDYQIKYSVLLSVAIEQLFYQNKICPAYKVEPVLDIMCVPTEECKSIMNNLDMLFRTSGNSGGFTVLGRVSGKNGGGNDLLRFQPGKTMKLSFWMILRNPDLLGFNDLPLQPPDNQFYYFSNQVADLAAPRNSLHLTKDATGVKGINELITLSRSTYRFHFGAAVTAGTAKVKHKLTGAEVLPWSIVNIAGQADLAFNLSTLLPGICELYINNVLEDTFYYADSMPTQPVFGIIECALSPLLPANYRVIEPDRSLKPPAPQYLIRFKNRQTLWRYTVELLPNSPLYLEMAALSPANKIIFLNKLNIVSNDTGVTFKKGVVSDTAIQFVSMSALPLKEKYVSGSSATHDPLTLSLKKLIGDPQEDAVKTDLPCPPVGTINNLSIPFIYSDIFLTL